MDLCVESMYIVLDYTDSWVESLNIILYNGLLLIDNIGYWAFIVAAVLVLYSFDRRIRQMEEPSEKEQKGALQRWKYHPRRGTSRLN